LAVGVVVWWLDGASKSRRFYFTTKLTFGDPVDVFVVVSN